MPTNQWTIPHVSDQDPNVSTMIPSHEETEAPPRTVAVTSLALKSNYGLFNRNNIYIRSWSWNYRGCWHQTCPPIATQQCVLDTIHCNLRSIWTSEILFSVAASHRLHWAICAPAADRSHGCHFSGTLSGIEPQSSVTRQRQGSPLHYLLPDRW